MSSDTDFQLYLDALKKQKRYTSYRSHTKGQDNYDRCASVLSKLFPSLLNDEIVFILYASTLFTRKLKRALCFTRQGLYFYYKKHSGSIKWNDIETLERVNGYRTKINDFLVSEGDDLHKTLHGLYTQLAGISQRFSEIRSGPIFLEQCIACNKVTNLITQEFRILVEDDIPNPLLSKYTSGALLLGAPVVGMVIGGLLSNPDKKELLFSGKLKICKDCFKLLSNDEKRKNISIDIDKVASNKTTDFFMTKFISFLPEFDRHTGQFNSYSIWIRNLYYANEFKEINTGHITEKQKSHYEKALGSSLSKEGLKVAHRWRYWSNEKFDCFPKLSEAKKLNDKFELDEPVLVSFSYGLGGYFIVTTKHIAWKGMIGRATVMEHQEFTLEHFSPIAESLNKNNRNGFMRLWYFLSDHSVFVNVHRT